MPDPSHEDLQTIEVLVKHVDVALARLSARLAKLEAVAEAARDACNRQDDAVPASSLPPGHVFPLRELHLALAALDAQDDTTPCDGSSDCKATRHIEGCFACSVAPLGMRRERGHPK